MNRVAILFFLLILLVIIQGCHEALIKESFDKQKWVEKEDWDYPLRNNIVDDLVKKHKIKGLNYRQVIALLDEPQGKDSASVYYQIVMNFGDDIDPVYTKSLLITFNKDSIVNNVTIKEWKKR